MILQRVWPRAFLFAAVVAGFNLSAAERFDWPHWRGPSYNGISTETNFSLEWPSGTPKLLWRTNVGVGFSSFAVSEGMVLTMGNRNNQESVYAFDVQTGKSLWTHSYPAPVDPKYYEGGPSATPSVSGGKVFTLSRRGDVFCLDATSGKVIWKKNLAVELGLKLTKWGFAGSPLFLEDRIIVNVGRAGVALNPESGRILWSSGKEKAGYATPVPFQIGSQKGVLIFGAKELFALNPQDGREFWRIPWNTDYDINAADPILSGSEVFVSSGYGTGGGLWKINQNKADLIWKNQNMHNHFNSSVLIGGHLYGISGHSGKPSELRCVEWKSGKLKWSERSTGLGSLMAAGNRLVILSENGELIVAEADPARFHPLARAQVLGGKCWTVPVLSNGRLFCRNASGNVMAYDLSPKQLLSEKAPPL